MNDALRPRTASSCSPPDALWGDRLGDSVITLLLMTVLQRLIGFVRSLLICRFLPPEQLGQWDLALGFLELTAPIVVLGIPGSFGRYVEHYRQRGLLRGFVRRTASVTLALVLIGVALIACAPEAISWLVYGSSAQWEAMRWMSLALGAVIVYYFGNTLLTALRRSRTVQRIEFVNSLVFAVLAIALACLWRADASSVLLAYALAALTSAVMSGCLVRRIWRLFPEDDGPLPHAALWRQILPFALAVWGTNWLANAFDLADRYMIVQLSGLPTEKALAMVGNYHSSRVLPLVLVSATGTLAAIMLPYLTRDWERGLRDAVVAQLALACKLLSILLTAAALGILAVAPVLFSTVLADKFAAGLAMLPWTLTYSVWFGLARVAQKYLWCAQRVRLAALAWGGGLTINVLLNMLLLPRFGLKGVVLATSAGNLAALGLVLLFSWRMGMRFSRGTGLAVVLPLVLLLPLPGAAVLFVGVPAIAAAATRIFTAEEKSQLSAIVRHYGDRLKRRLAVASPAASSNHLGGG